MDLVYHALAYLKVDNASDCYCPNYISKIAVEKRDFDYDIAPNIELLREYYNRNFQRLAAINFLPFFCDSFDEMKDMLLNFEGFAPDDLQYFINPFVEILDKESAFYFSYWDALHTNSEDMRCALAEQLEISFAKFACVLDYFGQPVQVALSHSITRNGRGCGTEDGFFALAPVRDDFSQVFFTLFHEITHGLTDGLLQDINMEDGSHALSETMVILADYYLVKAITPEDARRYLQWMESPSESAFLSEHRLDQEMNEKLQCLIRLLRE